MRIERFSINISALGKCGNSYLFIFTFGKQFYEGNVNCPAGTKDAPVNVFCRIVYIHVTFTPLSFQTYHNPQMNSLLTFDYRFVSNYNQQLLNNFSATILVLRGRL